MTKEWKSELFMVEPKGFMAAGYDAAKVALPGRLKHIEDDGWTIFSVCPPTHQSYGYFILYFRGAH